LDINRKEETHWIKYSILQEDEREEKEEEEVLTKLEDFTMYLQKSQKTKNQAI